MSNGTLTPSIVLSMFTLIQIESRLNPDMIQFDRNAIYTGSFEHQNMCYVKHMNACGKHLSMHATCTILGFILKLKMDGLHVHTFARVYLSLGFSLRFSRACHQKET